MLCSGVKTNKTMKNKRKDLRLKRRRKKNNSTTNFQPMIQNKEIKFHFTLGTISPTTEERTKFIQVLKFTTHQEEDQTSNLADRHINYH